MTVSTTAIQNSATGDGSTTVFSYTFTMLSNTDLDVYINGVLTGSGYSVTRAGDNVGGMVTFSTAPVAGASILFVRNVDLTQETIFSTEGKIPSANISNTVDKLTMACQQINDAVSRSLRLTSAAASSGADPSLPAFVALDILRVNAAGTGLEWVTPQAANLDTAAYGPLPAPLDTGVLHWNGTTLANILPADLIALVPPAVSGDVFGPGSSGANSIPLYSNTTGKLLKAGVALGSAGQVLMSNGAGAAPSFQTTTAAVKPSQLGKNKMISAAAGAVLTCLLNNGQFVQGGDQAYTVKGTTNGYSPWGPVVWDATYPVDGDVTIVDWAWSGSSLYAVLSNGTAYSGGRNDVGQLGQNSATLNFPVMTRIEQFVTDGLTINAVYCDPGGAYATVGRAFWVDSTNKVWAAGYNANGELGTTDLVNRGTGTGAGVKIKMVFDGAANAITDIQTQEAGVGFSGILCNGTLYTTGYNGNGQLGLSTATTPIKAFTAVTLSNVTSFKLFQTSSPAGNVAARTSASSGSLYVWGSNSFYQCANGGTANLTGPGSALVTGVSATAGDYGFCGSATAISVFCRCTNGDLYTWGANGQNNLFLNGVATQTTPSKVMSTTCAKVWGVNMNAGAVYGNLYALDTSNVMRFAGTNIVNSIFATTPDTAFKATGAYRCDLPHELAGDVNKKLDSISDLLLISTFNSALTKGLLLTTAGSLYGCGYSSDYALTNWQGMAVAQPSMVYNRRLNQHLWGT